jgi:hypothetical protein
MPIRTDLSKISRVAKKPDETARNQQLPQIVHASRMAETMFNGVEIKIYVGGKSIRFCQKTESLTEHLPYGFMFMLMTALLSTNIINSLKMRASNSF